MTVYVEEREGVFGEYLLFSFEWKLKSYGRLCQLELVHHIILIHAPPRTLLSTKMPPVPFAGPIRSYIIQ